MYEAKTTLGSKIEIEIAAAFTEIPGVQNIEVPDGENSVFEAGGLADDVNTMKPTGVSDVGRLTFSYFVDPTDTVHQHLQNTHLAGGAGVNVRVYMSATGKIKTGVGTLTKHEEKAEKKNGWMVECEIVLEDKWVVTDPA